MFGVIPGWTEVFRMNSVVIVVVAQYWFILFGLTVRFWRQHKTVAVILAYLRLAHRVSVRSFQKEHQVSCFSLRSCSLDWKLT
ncbi:hypothetical protein EMCRGX_G016782 [Ephydatia muelleri]